MKLRVIRFGLALLFSAAGAGLCHADCAALDALAQQRDRASTLRSRAAV